MGVIARFPIILNETFIEATRDTGYRSTAAAVAELVDNALQAEAKVVRVFVREDGDAGISLAVLDDGSGMDGPTLRRALQFGGSMRFGDRVGLGRFGMGLPNASVSQARRVEVCTWKAPNACIASHLDVDEIATGDVTEIPTVHKSSLPKWAQEFRGFSGTLVVWSKCDRLRNRRLSTVAKKLLEPLGRIFRHFIWEGVEIWVNDDRVVGIDPLFLNKASPLSGATPFGEPLTFEMRVPGQPGKTSTVKVRFSELPVAKWHDMPVEEKRMHRIVDGAGLSILRANREVDFGWWFFGSKRRENYDSWWRGELSFGPELDELFAITHSKQGINPTAEVREILTADLETVARQLNGRVQDAFAAVKAAPPVPMAPKPVPARDRPKEAAPATRQTNPASELPAPGPDRSLAHDYTVSTEALGEGGGFFDAELAQGRWRLVLNIDHPFYRRVYRPLRGPTNEGARRMLEKLLLAHARTLWTKGRKRIDTAVLRATWAAELAELLGDGQ